MFITLLSKFEAENSSKKIFSSQPFHIFMIQILFSKFLELILFVACCSFLDFLLKSILLESNRSFVDILIFMGWLCLAFTKGQSKISKKQNSEKLKLFIHFCNYNSQRIDVLESSNENYVNKYSQSHKKNYSLKNRLIVKFDFFKIDFHWIFFSNSNF